MRFPSSGFLPRLTRSLSCMKTSITKEIGLRGGRRLHCATRRLSETRALADDAIEWGRHVIIQQEPADGIECPFNCFSAASKTHPLGYICQLTLNSDTHYAMKRLVISMQQVLHSLERPGDECDQRNSSKICHHKQGDLDRSGLELPPSISINVCSLCRRLTALRAMVSFRHHLQA